MAAGIIPVVSKGENLYSELNIFKHTTHYYNSTHYYNTTHNILDIIDAMSGESSVISGGLIRDLSAARRESCISH